VFARSELDRGQSPPAQIVGSNPTGYMDVCLFVSVVCCQVVYDGPITRPEGSYRL